MTKVILVEGKDDIEFIQALLRSLGKINEDIRVEKMDGIGSETQRIDQIKKDLYANGLDFERLVIITDEDLNPQQRFRHARQRITASGFVAPNEVGIFSNGTPACAVFLIEPLMLEGLIWSSLTDGTFADIKNCIESYVECLGAKKIQILPKHFYKSRLEAFFAVKPNKNNEIRLSIGQLVAEDWFNPNHPAFEKLTIFLQQL